MRQIKIFNSKEELENKLPPNSIRLLKIGDKRISLIRHGSGFFALDDECTHDRASLSQGYINNVNEIVCPLHQYRFDLATGTCSKSSCKPVAVYKTYVEDSCLYIEL